MKTININLKATLTPDGGISTWNNINKDTNLNPSLLDTTSTASLFAFQYLDEPPQAYTSPIEYLSGGITGDAAWVDQSAVWRDGHGFDAAGDTARLSGLDTNKTYTIKVFATANISGRTAQASVDGSATQQLAIENNNSLIMLFEDVTPDISGEIDIFLNSATASSAYISAIQLIENDAPNQAPIADNDTFSIFDNAANGSTVGTFTATDSDGTVDAYSITGSTLAINNAGVITIADNTGITAGTDITATVTATDNDGATDTAVITVNVTAPSISITSVSTTSAKAGATVTVNLQDASVSGKVLSCPAGFITLVSQNATSLVFNIPEPKTFGTRVLYYNEAITFSIADGTDIVSFTLTIEPEVGYDFDTITELSGIFADDVGLTIGSQAYGHFKKGSGTAVLAQGLISPDTIAQYEYWLRDVADGVWSNSSAIELFEDPTKTKVTIANPVSTDGSVFFGYTGLAPVNGDFILHDPVTSPSSIPVTVLASGVWVLDSMPTVDQTFEVYSATAGGMVGSTATLTYTVPVDTEIPVITLTGSATVEVTQGNAYTEQGATWTDNVDGSGDAVVGGATVDTATIASYVVTYDYTDAAGNVATTVTRTVNVTAATDTEIPVITLIGSSTVSVVQNTSYTDAGANVTDNVDAGSILVGAGSVNIGTIGSYIITFDYTDAAGNVADTVTRTVNVVAAPDTEIPVITLIGSSTVSVVQDTSYTDTGANVTDNVDAGSVIYGTGTVTIGTVGSYVLSYDYTDAAGNVATTVTRTVNVISSGTYTVSGTLVNAAGASVPNMTGLSMTLYSSAEDLHNNTNALETITGISVTSGSFTATATIANGTVYMKLFNPGDYSSHASGQIVSA